MIGLSTPEFSKLTLLKAHWEDWTEKETTWGEFLMQVSAPASAGMALLRPIGAAEPNSLPDMGFEIAARQGSVVPGEIAASADPKLQPPTA